LDEIKMKNKLTKLILPLVVTIFLSNIVFVNAEVEVNTEIINEVREEVYFDGAQNWYITDRIHVTYQWIRDENGLVKDQMFVILHR
jgi:hypothetical protein